MGVQLQTRGPAKIFKRGPSRGVAAKGWATCCSKTDRAFQHLPRPRLLPGHPQYHHLPAFCLSEVPLAALVWWFQEEQSVLLLLGRLNNP